MGKPYRRQKTSTESTTGNSKDDRNQANDIMQRHNKQAKKYHQSYRMQIAHQGGKVEDEPLELLANQLASRKRYSEPAQLRWSDWEKLDFAFFQFLKRYKMIDSIHTDQNYTISCYKRNQNRVAVKHLTNVGSNDHPVVLQRLQDEYKLLKELKHANIIQVSDWYNTKSDFMMIMPLLHLNLTQYLHQCSRAIPEDDVKAIINQVLQAVRYLHSQRYVHCNIRPCNIVFYRPKSLHVVLCGFTSAVHVPAMDYTTSENLQANKQTISYSASSLVAIQDYNYCAPELFQLHSSYNFAADCWSIGVLLYRLLFNLLPFIWDEDSIGRVSRYYLERIPILFKNSRGEKLSTNCQNLIVNLLNLDVSRRCDISNALQNEWLNDHPSCITMIASSHSNDASENDD